MSPVLSIKTDMFHPLKGHYQAVKTFLKRSIHSLIHLCIYRVKLYDNIDVTHKKCITYMLTKLQIFKIHTHTCFYKESKCYSVGTYTLKGQGCDKFHTEQIDITNSTIKFSLSML